MKNTTTGQFNVGVGVNTLLANSTGFKNSALGMESLRDNSTGIHNTAVGQAALIINTIGSANTGVGTGSLSKITDANENTALGFNAGGGFSIGSNNVFIGSGADVNANNLFNTVAIGQNARTTANNQVRLGNTTTTSIGGVVGFSNVSDGRFKRNVREGVKGLEFIMRLRPVTYLLDIDGLNKQLNTAPASNGLPLHMPNENANTVFSGFIAQEVEQAGKSSGYEFSGVDKPKNAGDLYGLRYAEFVVPLVKAMQEQQQIIMDLKKRLDALEQSR
jgi:trimeric autotransporter adhesin